MLLIKDSGFKRKGGGWGGEGGGRVTTEHTVGKNLPPRPVAVPEQVESQHFFFCPVFFFSFPERSSEALRAQERQTGRKDGAKEGSGRRKLERKPGEGVLKA